MLLGIKNGMVMQRNDRNVCDIQFSTDTCPEIITYSGFSCGTGTVTSLGNLQYRLTGIPVGGPYCIEIGRERFEDIYVGDVWILAGQSNMEGIGHRTEADKHFVPSEEVRALYLYNEWGSANHPLHDLGSSFFGVHILLGGTSKPIDIGVGPGLSFGLSMNYFTGVPQGLICCAHGATNLAYHWDPKRANEGPDSSLYAAMLQRVVENGNHVRGMFWYQGCSDAEEIFHGEYTKNMVEFVSACRRDLDADLPIVQVQIGRTISRPTADYCKWWISIQEQQRIMHESIPYLSTVSAITMTLDDAIHLDSDSNRKLGEEAAEAMCQLLSQSVEGDYLTPPQMDCYWIEKTSSAGSWMAGWAELHIRYKNLHGGLTSSGRPMGFDVFSNQADQIPQYVYKTELKEDTVVLYLAATPEMLANSELYYGYGQNPACNITDMAGRAIPVMGPISLRGISYDQSRH